MLYPSRKDTAEKTTVIISTYNNPASLRMCLLGMLSQTVQPSQIIIADDGSSPETATILRDSIFAGLPLESVWHPDHGWRKCRILNLAITHAKGDYLIFFDGDTIPRSDLIASHLKHSRKRMFLSGGCVNIPKSVYLGFSDAEIIDNTVFQPEHLLLSWPDAKKHFLRLRPGILEPQLNLLTWRHCVLRGANFSAWREDLVRVNGFNEDFGYGSDDRELGVRLKNSGISSRWLKFSLVQLHLDHSRSGYLNHGVANKQRWEFRKLFLTQKSLAEKGLTYNKSWSHSDATSFYRHTAICEETGPSGLLAFPERRSDSQIEATSLITRAA